MKPLSLVSFLTTLLVLTVSTAQAQAAEVAPAKSPTPKDGVQYLVPIKPEGPPQKFNIRVSPLGFLIGYFNLDFDFKVSDQWTFGPTFSYWRFDSDSSLFTNGKIRTTSTSIGVRGTWAQHGAFKNGFYFTPMFQYRTAKAEGVSSFSGTTITGEGSLPVITGLVGYQHWLNDNLNFNFGAGLSAGTQSTKIEVREGTSTTSVETSQTGGLALDLMVGYSF